jgi:hypothetical protein
LAWVARFPLGSDAVTVYHGPMVETADRWAVEAVWAGPFEEGGFDQTDLVFGTGVRLRDEGVVFVASGTTFDRLWHCRQGDSTFVANSLPALLAVADWRLVDDADYVTPLRSGAKGLDAYERRFPASRGMVEVVYFDNLLWDGLALRRVSKPAGRQEFECFAGYASFLAETAEAIAANLASRQRTATVGALASVSKGYDSGVAAWAARKMGATRAVTIEKSNSLWRGSDAGDAVADALGLLCEHYPLYRPEYPNEVGVWASSGMSLELNWTQFDFAQPVCVFCSGCHGDAVWSIDAPTDRPFARPSLAGSGITEWRLGAGVIHCPVPVWGIGGIESLRAISQSDAMSAWRLGGDYDRPIPRRILEAAGVPRDAFGQCKRNTQSPARLQWPISPEAHNSYVAWRKQRSMPVAGPRKIGWLRRLALFDRLLRTNTRHKLALPSSLRRWEKYSDSSETFRWANETLRVRYAAGLVEAGIEVGV